MSEHDHQVALFRWAQLQSAAVPALKLMFAIPNGGARNIVVAGKLKAEGVKAGVPDILLPIPRGVYHGLFIELKQPKGRVAPHQAEWIAELGLQGYRSVVCYGWEDAKDTIMGYLN
ncbi:VRR-NUC domain-containing protein [Chitinibacter tainanensis]|uniref:VRR-NUC domain-containing protein n=1 Tax=Chitinibacter tainanensis TaxID=230667 RepID=UPI0023535D75|nr:VRR-NUC domain-containing protein [Chitinibacter tainanensis]